MKRNFGENKRIRTCKNSLIPKSNKNDSKHVTSVFFFFQNVKYWAKACSNLGEVIKNKTKHR